MTYCYFSQTKNPIHNMRIEEYLLSEGSDSTILFLYKNEPCILAAPQTQLALTDLPIYHRPSPGESFLCGDGVVQFAFITARSRFSPAAQITVVQKALQFLDIPTKPEGMALYLSSGGECCQTSLLELSDNALHHGALLVRSDLKGLSNLNPGRQYANLADENPAVSDSYVASAMKYAFETEWGKCTELYLRKSDVLRKENAI